LAWIFAEKWFWLIILVCASVILIPFLIVTLILNFPPYLRAVATVALVVSWGVAGAFKDWTKEKREQEEKMGQPASA
jgi:cell shape-determining protein MreC